MALFCHLYSPQASISAVGGTPSCLRNDSRDRMLPVISERRPILRSSFLGVGV